MNSNFLIVLVSVLISSCSFSMIRSTYDNSSSLVAATKGVKAKPSLKLHMKNGGVYVFDKTWEVDSTILKVKGLGMQFDLSRNFINQGTLTVPVDSIMLYETNLKRDSPYIIPAVGFVSTIAIDILALYYLLKITSVE